MIVLAWTALVSGPSGGNRISSRGFFHFRYINDVRDDDIHLFIDEFLLSLYFRAFCVHFSFYTPIKMG